MVCSVWKTPAGFLTGNLLQLRSNGEDHGTYVTEDHNLVISESEGGPLRPLIETKELLVRGGV